jgi:DNA polymerase-3 subunit delta'
MTEDTLFPWLSASLDRLLEQRDRLAHAYLLAGQPGLGKATFAVHFARAMLCNQPTPRACGSCHSCHLFDTGSHPDLHVLQSDKYRQENPGLLAEYAARYPKPDGHKSKKPSAIIAIDQVRNVLPDINTRPLMAANRLIILHPAEDLFVNAANSLLKALEEPPSDTYFLLISHDPGRLLPTLRSRCNRIDFRLPEMAVSERWLSEQIDDPSTARMLLEKAHGVPLHALDLANGKSGDGEEQLAKLLAGLSDGELNPVVAAAGLLKDKNIELKEHLAMMQRLISSMIRNRASGQDATSHLHVIANRLNSKVLFGYLDNINAAVRQANAPLDNGLVLEDLLARWQELTVSRHDQRKTG